MIVGFPLCARFTSHFRKIKHLKSLSKQLRTQKIFLKVLVTFSLVVLRGDGRFFCFERSRLRVSSGKGRRLGLIFGTGQSCGTPTGTVCKTQKRSWCVCTRPSACLSRSAPESRREHTIAGTRAAWGIWQPRRRKSFHISGQTHTTKLMHVSRDKLTPFSFPRFSEAEVYLGKPL